MAYSAVPGEDSPGIFSICKGVGIPFTLFCCD